MISSKLTDTVTSRGRTLNVVPFVASFWVRKRAHSHFIALRFSYKDRLKRKMRLDLFGRGWDWAEKKTKTSGNLSKSCQKAESSEFKWLWSAFSPETNSMTLIPVFNHNMRVNINKTLNSLISVAQLHVSESEKWPWLYAERSLTAVQYSFIQIWKQQIFAHKIDLHPILKHSFCIVCNLIYIHACRYTVGYIWKK